MCAPFCPQSPRKRVDKQWVALVSKQEAEGPKAEQLFPGCRRNPEFAIKNDNKWHGASQTCRLLVVGGVLTTNSKNLHRNSFWGAENKLFWRQQNIFANIFKYSMLPLPLRPCYKNLCISLLMSFKRWCEYSYKIFLFRMSSGFYFSIFWVSTDGQEILRENPFEIATLSFKYFHDHWSSTQAPFITLDSPALAYFS